MLSFLPNAHELGGVAGMAATLLLFLALGGAAAPRRTVPEVRLAAGWGMACLVLTAWGVLTPWSLRWPAAALGLAAVTWLARPGWRARLTGTDWRWSPVRQPVSTAFRPWTALRRTATTFVCRPCRCTHRRNPARPMTES
jgi:hypothetical protein